MGYNHSIMSTNTPQPDSAEYQFEMTGGALCLDFVNTVGDRPDLSNEHLHTYADILSWARQASILTNDQVDQMQGFAEQKPGEVEEVFARAVALRESLYEIFSNLASGDRPPERDLAVLNRWLAESLAHLRLEESDGDFSWSWSGAETALERMLWPVVRSAGDLLASGEAQQVRECASETCSWLFVDRSRTHRRRWCDMKTCGNRAKARRYYKRKQQKDTA